MLPFRKKILFSAKAKESTPSPSIGIRLVGIVTVVGSGVGGGIVAVAIIHVASSGSSIG